MPPVKTSREMRYSSPGNRDMAPKIRNEVNGVLLVDKPMDWTSHDVVNCMKHRFNLSRIGHCGTLDPLATGLLVVLMGKATKLQDRLMSESKVYQASMRLGVESDTEDSTGNLVSTSDVSSVTEASLRAAMSGFMGKVKQIPPMVSAIKKDGKPLYALARKGITIEREPREIEIYSLEMTSCSLPDADFTVHCSKGTYVRTLCADIGKALGVGAIMTGLRRVKCGDLPVDKAYTVEQIKSWELDDLRGAVMPPECFLPAAAERE